MAQIIPGPLSRFTRMSYCETYRVAVVRTTGAFYKFTDNKKRYDT